MNRILGLTRYTVVIPVIASLLGALAMMARGTIEVGVVISQMVAGQLSLKASIVGILDSVDAFLLGTVLLVIGYGLYELFVDTVVSIPSWLKIGDLDDLKSKLVGVVVAIIGIVFVGELVDPASRDYILNFGIGAGAVIAGLSVFTLATRRGKS